MAEPTCKRPTDAEDNQNSFQLCEELNTKRLRPYDDEVLSLLKEDVDTTSHDLSTFSSPLQHELSSCMATPLSISSSSSSSPNEEEEEEEKEKESVMMLLFEASGDELGLPSRGEGFGNGAVSCALPWDIEAEDADYQTLVQSELFM